MIRKSRIQASKDVTKLLVSFLALALVTRASALTPLARYILKRLFDIRLEVMRDRREDVTICRYRNGADGALSFSIDFDLPTKAPEYRGRIREATVKTLQLGEHYETPFSWGICGALAIQEPKIYEQILFSHVNHDLGVHTFNHIDLSSSTHSTNEVRNDLLASVEALGKARRPVSFIFPWNREGHFSLLQRLGFVVYRGKEKKLGYPTKLRGLWNVHETYYFSEKSSNLEAFTVRLFVRSLIDLAIAQGCVLHVWTHPWSMNVNGDTEEFLRKIIEPLLSYAARKRDDGLLWIATMRELANYCEARRNCFISDFAEERNEIKLMVTCSVDSIRFDSPPEITLRVSVPPQRNVLRVLVNGQEVTKKDSTRGFWNIVKKENARFLLLTLSFDDPTNMVQIVTEIHRSTI